MEKRDRGAEKRAQDFFAAPRRSLTSGWQAVDAKRVNAILVHEAKRETRTRGATEFSIEPSVRSLHPPPSLVAA